MGKRVSGRGWAGELAWRPRLGANRIHGETQEDASGASRLTARRNGRQGGFNVPTGRVPAQAGIQRQPMSRNPFDPASQIAEPLEEFVANARICTQLVGIELHVPLTAINYAVDRWRKLVQKLPGNRTGTESVAAKSSDCPRQFGRAARRHARHVH